MQENFADFFVRLLVFDDFCCLLIFLDSFKDMVKQFGIQTRPYILWALIWDQTVCKGYWQVTLVGEEFKY